MNFENMSDSCRGDSGGGLILKGSTPQEDVLVGIVSAGFGCAHPILPAIYARISEVHDWIEEQVCQLSENPPDNFHCVPWTDTLPQQYPATVSDPFRCDEYPVGRDTLNHPCSNDDLFVNITVEINLDTTPQELGWILRTKDSSREGGWVTKIERPIFTYRDAPPMSTITESLTIPNNQKYEIVLLDSYGDGINPLALTSSPILRILEEVGNAILSVDEFTSHSNSGYYFSFEFIVGVLPTNAPSVSPAPTTTITPTLSLTALLPYILVVITFDHFPENIGFQLEMLKNTVGLDDDENELLHVVYPGYFSPDYEWSKISLKVPLRASGSEPQLYTFTVTSNEGHGFDVASGAGYEVWLGDNDEYGELLFEGGQFYYEETNSFEIEPYFTLPTPIDQNNNPTSTATSTSSPCRCTLTSFLFSAFSIYIIYL
jgi:hypothetical protein